MIGSHRSSIRISLCAVGLAALCLGCKSYTAPSYLPFKGKSESETTTDNTPSKAKKKKEDIEFERPVSMAVVWVDSVLTPPGQPAVRGFGGRAFFYNEDGEAVRVDGDFVVYAYNDSDERFKSNVPDRKYVFRSDELQGHHTDSEFGACYNFWVPWDKVGGERTTVTLLPQLVVGENQKVQGTQSVNVLPGTEGKISDHALVEEVTRSTTRIRSPSPTRTVSYAEEEDLLAGIDPASLNRTTIRSTTLNVPPSLARRMQMNRLAAQQGTPGAAPMPQMAPGQMPPGQLAPGQFTPGQMAQGTMAQGDMPQAQAPVQPQPINQVTYGEKPVYGMMGNQAAANMASNGANPANYSGPPSSPMMLDLPGHLGPAPGTGQLAPPPASPTGFGVPGSYPRR